MLEPVNSIGRFQAHFVISETHESFPHIVSKYVFRCLQLHYFKTDKNKSKQCQSDDSNKKSFLSASQGKFVTVHFND